MKTNETIAEYFGRVLTVANHMRSNGESMFNTKIVKKILRTLIEKYTYVVVSIEESKNIEEMSIEELQITLVVHEQKFKKNEQEDEQMLKIETSESSSSRGRGRGRFSQRGRGRGRGLEKQTRKNIPKSSSWRANDILELVHSDICGPIFPPSNTRKRHLKVSKSLKARSKQKQASRLKLFEQIKGEYVSDAFNSFCKEHGVKRQLTTSFTPQQNGVAERKNKQIPTKALTHTTPEEAWSGEKPTVNHFRVWGSVAHVHIPKEKRKKLDDKSFICILTGVSEESKAYRLINPLNMKVVVSKDVVFEEQKAWNWSEDIVAEHKAFI
ncbi:retrovirus-related pol polyprotein from transposon TNT 1-94 [Tanacetum coccineum]